jgi:hypothetical protein
VKQKVYNILHKKRSKLGQRSIMQLVDSNTPFSFYFGETKRRVKDEHLEFLGRRGTNTDVLTKDGKTQRNRPVILRGDTTLPDEHQHFTPVEARKD